MKNRKQNVNRLPFRFLLWATAFVIFVPLSALIALHLPLVQKEVINIIVSHIESATALKVQLASYRLIPFSEIRISGLNVESSGESILECETAHVRYGFIATWPYIHLKEVHLEKPVLRLEKDRKGQWLLPKWRRESAGFHSPDSPSTAFLPFALLRIESGAILVSQDGFPVLEVRGVNGTFCIRAIRGPDGRPMFKLDMDGWPGDLDISHWEHGGFQGMPYSIRCFSHWTRYSWHSGCEEHQYDGLYQRLFGLRSKPKWLV